jgi:hypothetical protein
MRGIIRTSYTQTTRPPRDGEEKRLMLRLPLGRESAAEAITRAVRTMVWGPYIVNKRRLPHACAKGWTFVVRMK